MNDARRSVLKEERRRTGQGTEKRQPEIRSHTRPFQPSSLLRAAPLHASGSRRQFLKAGVAFLGVSALWLMDRIVRRTESIPEDSETTLTVPWNTAQEVHFYEPAIAVNHADRVAVFSSKCPHMGCRINRSEGQQLVCGCHGSRFDINGNAVQGPATRSLEPLPFTLDRAAGTLRVTLRSSQA